MTRLTVTVIHFERRTLEQIQLEGWL